MGNVRVSVCLSVSTQARSRCRAGAVKVLGGVGRGGAGEGEECYRVIERSHPGRPRVCHDGRHLGQAAEL